MTLAINTDTNRQAQLFVRNWAGQTHVVEISLDEKIEQLKKIIFYKESVPVEEQSLLFAGKLLEDGKILEDYEISPYATLSLGLRLKGGTKDPSETFVHKVAEKAGEVVGVAVGTAAVYTARAAAATATAAARALVTNPITAIGAYMVFCPETCESN